MTTLLRIRVAATLIGGILVVLAAASIAGAEPAAQKPRWKVVPGVRMDFGEGNVVLGLASGRAWIAATRGQGMAVTSVRVSGGT